MWHVENHLIVIYNSKCKIFVLRMLKAKGHRVASFVEYTKLSVTEKNKPTPTYYLILGFIRLEAHPLIMFHHRKCLRGELTMARPAHTTVMKIIVGN